MLCRRRHRRPHVGLLLCYVLLICIIGRMRQIGSIHPHRLICYLTPVSALSTPDVMTTVSRPRVFPPPLVPPRGVPIVSREQRSRWLWNPEGASANAAAMRGVPPMTEAERVPRVLRRPYSHMGMSSIPGIPWSQEEEGIKL